MTICGFACLQGCLRDRELLPCQSTPTAQISLASTNMMGECWALEVLTKPQHTLHHYMEPLYFCDNGDRMCRADTFFAGRAFLSEGAGYAVVVGFGERPSAL